MITFVAVVDQHGKFTRLHVNDVLLVKPIQDFAGWNHSLARWIKFAQFFLDFAL